MPITNDTPKAKKSFGIEIDLSKYSNMSPVFQHGGELVGFDIIALAHVDETDANFANHGIRAEGTDENDVRALQTDFEENGWSYGSFPPIIEYGPNGEIIVKDGRTRIVAAKRAEINGVVGQPYIPVAVYSYEEDIPESTRHANGIIANHHRVQRRSAMGDFIAAVVTGINTGEIKNDADTIDKYLRDVCKVEKFWSQTSGVPGRIRAEAMRQSDRGESTVVKKTKEAWKEWIVRNVKLPESATEDNLVVLRVDNSSTIPRGWVDYVLNFKHGTPHFVLFTESKTKPKSAMKAMQKFVNEQYSLWKNSYEQINRQTMNGGLKALSDTELKATAPFKVLGAVPQFAEHHNITGRSLVNIDGYCGE